MSRTSFVGALFGVRAHMVVAAALALARPVHAEPSDGSPAGKRVRNERSAGETSPRERTTDEIAQLYGIAVAHGGLTGYTLSTVAFDGSRAAFVAGGLAFAAAEASIVWVVDRGDSFGYGAPQAIVSDAWIGTGIAAAWIWRNSTTTSESDEWSDSRRAVILWTGATLGAGLGALRWQLSPSSPGRAALLSSSALWIGAESGLVTGAIDTRGRDRSASLATAIGIEAGVIAGAVFLPRGDTPISRVRALDMGGALGGIVAGGAFALLADERVDSRGALASAAIGVMGGGVTGWLLGPMIGRGAPGFSLRLAPGGGAILCATMGQSDELPF